MTKVTNAVCGPILLITVALNGAAIAQGRTIPEELANAGVSLGHSAPPPSGPIVPLERVIADAELILRGVIGESRSYLSEDEMKVLTDYAVGQTLELYRRDEELPNTASVPVRVTVPGGAVTINNLSYVATYAAYPKFERGMEVLLLLKRAGDGYVLARNYYGAFAIADDRLKPLTGVQRFGAEIKDMSAADAIADIVAQRSRVPRQ